MKLLPLFFGACVGIGLMFVPLSSQSSEQSNAMAQSSHNCSVKVVPDPCIGNCLLKLENCNLNQLQTIYLDVYDGNGMKTQRTISYPSGSPRFHYSVDTSDPMAPGVYLVRIAHENTTVNRTVVQ